MRFPSDSDTSSDVSPERHHPLDQRHYKLFMEFIFVLSLETLIHWMTHHTLTAMNPMMINIHTRWKPCLDVFTKLERRQ